MTISDLPNQVQALLSQRQQHVEALAQIDRTLSAVSGALGGPVSVAPMRPAAVAKVAAKKRGRRGSHAISATDLVLNYLMSNPGATTKAITAFAASEGRAQGAVSNALSVLAKAGKIKRTPLGKGQMGSTYKLI